MNIIEPSVEILTDLDGFKALKIIELAGRTCYMSEDKVTDDSCIAFARMLLARKHESVLEHASVTFRMITNRGVLAEITRHRIASFSVQSTRYCDYNKKGLTFIKPCFWTENSLLQENKDFRFSMWETAMKQAEQSYNLLIKSGAKPEEAREVLPNSLATTIVCTMNIRELRHMLQLRTSKFAHPEFRKVATMLLIELVSKIPVVFDDIYEEVTGNKLEKTNA